MKHKKLLIAATAIFTVIVALAVFLLIWFWGDEYSDFGEFSPRVKIPGLGEGAVPQGIASYSTTYVLTDGDEKTSGTQDYYFISAYMKSGPSRIYVTGEKTGYVGYVTMVTEDGDDFYGHSGGIATNGENLWISSDGMVYVAKQSSTAYTNIAEEVIQKAIDNSGLKSSDPEFETIAFTASFNANCGADFLFYYDTTSTDKLYVGEFYRSGNYETDKRHRVTTPAGDYNTAFVYEYSAYNLSSYIYGLGTLSGSSSVGGGTAAVDVPKIQKIYSITGKIQGLAITTDGALVLSQSYGLANSHLLYYDWSQVTSTSKSYKNVVGYNFNYEGVKTVNGVPFTANPNIYFVDSSALLRDYSLPSMSEGLCVTSDSKINVLFESGCYKYRMFVRQITDSIYSFIPKKQS